MRRRPAWLPDLHIERVFVDAGGLFCMFLYPCRHCSSEEDTTMTREEMCSAGLDVYAFFTHGLNQSALGIASAPAIKLEPAASITGGDAYHRLN